MFFPPKLKLGVEVTVAKLGKEGDVMLEVAVDVVGMEVVVVVVVTVVDVPNAEIVVETKVGVCDLAVVADSLPPALKGLD